MCNNNIHILKKLASVKRLLQKPEGVFYKRDLMLGVYYVHRRLGAYACHTLRCGTRMHPPRQARAMIENHIYHIYNQGNNRQQIFFHEENYRFFAMKAKSTIAACTNMLGYCLMPNHFHFLVQVTDASLAVEEPDYPRLYPFHRAGAVSGAIKLLLSSYTKAINKAFGRTGSLFRQNTKIKATGTGDIDSYAYWCLHYIHMNPVRGGLVEHPSNWKWSSYNEYFGKGGLGLCQVDVGRDLLYMEVNDLQVPI